MLKVIFQAICSFSLIFRGNPMFFPDTNRSYTILSGIMYLDKEAP